MKENHGDGQSFKIVPLMSLKKALKERSVMIIATSLIQC